MGRYISQDELDRTNSNAKWRGGPPHYEYTPTQYSPLEKAVGAALFLPTLAVFGLFAIGIYAATTTLREPD